MAEYTPIYSVLVEAIAAVVLSVPVIGKRVGGAVVERVPLWLCVLLQIGVLIGGEVLVEGGKRNNIGGDSVSIKLCRY